MSAPTDRIYNPPTIGQHSVTDVASQFPSVQSKRVRLKNHGPNDAVIGTSDSVSGTNGFRLGLLEADNESPTLFLDNLDELWAVCPTATETAEIAFIVEF